MHFCKLTKRGNARYGTEYRARDVQTDTAGRMLGSLRAIWKVSKALLTVLSIGEGRQYGAPTSKTMT